MIIILRKTIDGSNVDRILAYLNGLSKQFGYYLLVLAINYIYILGKNKPRTIRM